MNKHIPCKRCDGRGFINWTFSEGNTGTATSYVCPDCNGSGVSVVPMTNADRIRASIEDNKKLAELTIKRKSAFRRTKGYTEILYVCSDGSVTDDWSIAFNREMDWLQQPAEEETV